MILSCSQNTELSRLMHMGFALNPSEWEKHVGSCLHRSKKGSDPFETANFLKQAFVDQDGLWRDLDFDGRFTPDISHDSTINAAIARAAQSIWYGEEEARRFQLEDALEAISKHSWTRYGSQSCWKEGSEPSDEPQSSVMPLYNAYEVEQRMDIGDWKGAVEVLRRCFGHMLDLGSTSFWEIIQKNGLPNEKGQEGLASLCHGWSGYPAAIFPRLLGYTVPGNTNHLMLFPYGPQCCHLEFAEAGIPVGKDHLSLKIEWDAKARIWRYSGLLPKQIAAGSVALPFSDKEIASLETVNCSRNGLPDKDAGFPVPAKVSDLKSAEEFSITVRLNSE